MMRLVQLIWHFLTIDIWRITENELNSFNGFLVTSLRALILSVKRFISDRLSSKASALTYSTLLAIVPTLALLFSIANGFGTRSIIESQILDSFPGQREILLDALKFVDLYLSQTKSGLFVGLGVILLFYTVLSLINNIEQSFNEIWYVKKNRSIYRQITDYFSLILLLPVFMVFSSGLTIFISTFVNSSSYSHVLSPLTSLLFTVLPFVITCSAFIFIYIYMPNTHVKAKNAIIPGILSGAAFQIFQYIYISGQIWVSKYNAIYGSFAALPLLLLWLQLSWIICLYGAALTHAAQTARNYSFEKETQTISR
ncbi:MAG: YihY/virulence factor BrkB family protein, partial [Bacteroidales bacterium]